MVTSRVRSQKRGYPGIQKAVKRRRPSGLALGDSGEARRRLRLEADRPQGPPEMLDRVDLPEARPVGSIWAGFVMAP